MDPLHPTDPSHIGRYPLTGRLGTGGMGQVYLARTPSRRQIVIKVIRPEFASEAGFRARFAREADSARKVGGFHTAQVIDADPDADAPWIATAHIPGPTLTQTVRENGPITPPALYILTTGLAEGLDAIHETGLVHRDLKPDNIILANDGPRIIDFGIARPLDADSMTTHGAVFGTLPYMSPEQTDGSHVGPASDIFSLGTVLAYSATGTNPFQGSTMAETLRKIISPAPDPGHIDAITRELITDCWNHGPDQRPTPAQILTRFQSLDLDDSWPPPRTDATVAYTPPVSDPSPPQAGDPKPTPSVQDISVTEQEPSLPPNEPPPPNPEPEVGRPTQPKTGKPSSAPEPAPAQHPVPMTRVDPAPQRDEGNRTRRNALLATGAVIVSIAAIGGLLSRNTAFSDGSSSNADASSSDSSSPSDETSASEEPGQAITILDGHSSDVNSVAFSPDGTTLATGSSDDTVLLWDIATGTEIISLDDHSDQVSSVAFSPDGTTLATGSWDDTVRLWDIESGEHVTTLEHTHSVRSVAFSPDGTTLATGGMDDIVRLWDIETGEETAVLEGHEFFLNSVAFSPDGTTLASGSDDDTARLWDVDTGEEIATLRGHDHNVTSVAFSPDGTTLATGGDDWTVRLWNADTGEHFTTLDCSLYVYSVAFSPDGTTLATGNCAFPLPVLLWDIAAEEAISGLDHNETVNSVAFSPDGTTLAVGSSDNTVLLWDIN
ncbi:protein kinase [Nocardiopsis sp. N85]|uniref:WD40 repeat domain-containing serine/threonine protein kinase n=1 Tax=Nocardiopsis sp. N85 TaxID=3029400 RepID=UPI00237F4504|nr:serine/threonine-protein kinase [Nocardiopsis sp. N85]MDE3721812.1 protein kinase [Nocardiopsis sp. N85]